MFLVNSRQGLVAAALSCSPVLVWITLTGHLFSRSYETILPSSLARVFSRPLGFSPCLPVAVSGTDTLFSHERSFSWQCGVNTFAPVGAPGHASVFNAFADFPAKTTYTLQPEQPISGVFSLLRPSAANNENKVVQECQPVCHRLRLSASA